MPSLELSMSSMTWIELQFMAALAAEGEARGVSDLRQKPELAALARPVINRALRRHVLRRAVSQTAPVDAGFRSEREFTEYCLRAALWVGEHHARRFFAFFDDLADAELERLWTCVAAVIETTGLTKAEQADADALACRIRLGVHRPTWSLLFAIIDGNRVAENTGIPADHDAALTPFLAVPLAA